MRYRHAGTAGPLVSAVGLDCGGFADIAAADRIVGAAIDAGITLFDTSDVAGDRGGAETVLGKVLRRHRGSVVIATKFGGDMGLSAGPRAARRYIHLAVEESLRRLGTDYIDLYQQHGPDDSMPIEETFSALHRLAVAGKIRHYGGVEYELWRLHEAAALAQTVRMIPLSSVQYRYGLLDRDAATDRFPACRQGGIGIIATDPTGGGAVTRHEGVARFARERGLGPLDVAIGHAAGQEGVAAVLVTAGSEEEAKAAAAAADWRPTPADLAALDALDPSGALGPSTRTEENHGPRR